MISGEMIDWWTVLLLMIAGGATGVAGIVATGFFLYLVTGWPTLANVRDFINGR